MSVEVIRGCGFRKVGGLYLCGGGLSMDCDRLPYELEICPTCGAGVKFTRGWTWLDWFKYADYHVNTCGSGECKCPPACPVCYPVVDRQPYGLLWVGEQFYTPQEFIQEALTLGVSRRIAAIPKNLKLGETWVLFAHKKAIVRSPRPEELDNQGYEAPSAEEGRVFKVAVQIIELPAIFYAFCPRRLELLVWQSEATGERLAELEKKGITPIIIPDGDVDHDPATPLKMTEQERGQATFARGLQEIRESLRR